MKLLHRIRGETGKRCLSFILAFAMLIGLMPAMLTQANAAQTGIVTSADATVTDTGAMHIWGTGIVSKPGSTIGSVGLDIIEDKSPAVPNGVYVGVFVRRTIEWIDRTKGTFSFDFEFYPSTQGTHTFTVGLYDTTSGAWSNISSNGFQTKWTNVSGLSAAPLEMANKPSAELRTINPQDTSFSFEYRNKYDGGRPITRSTLYWAKAGEEFSDAYAKPLIANTGYWTTDTVAGLVPGTIYQVKMESQNDVGTTTSAIYTVSVGTPTEPQNIQTFPGNNSITITWDAPQNLRGGSLKGYKLYDSQGSTTPFAVVGADVNTYTRTDRTNGFSQGFGIIRAYTQHGDGAIGWPATVWVGSPVPPNAPTITKTAGSRNIRIQTNEPNNNGDAITQYNIYVNGSLKKAVSGTKLDTTLNAQTDLGLADNTAYNISVSASNTRGEGPVSAVTNFTTSGPPAKVALANAEATKVTGQVKLTWTTPANNGGAITSVQVLQNGTVVKTLSASATPNEWQTGKMDTPGQTCTNFVTGLNDGTSYSFQVRAVNAYGQGTLSDAKSATPYRIPDAPTGLKVTRGVRTLTLNWNAAANGGNTVSKYNVCGPAKTPKTA